MSGDATPRPGWPSGPASARDRRFSERVVVLMAGQVVTTGLGIVTGFLMARLLGPADKGDYHLLILTPATAMVFLQLGIPQALGYSAAAGATRGLLRMTVTAAAVLSIAAFIIIAVLLPVIGRLLFDDLDPILVLAALSAVPLLLLATLSSAIVTALKAVHLRAALNIAQALASLASAIVLIGLLGLGVTGAVAGYLLAATILGVGMVLSARRALASAPASSGATYGSVLRFGLPLYPASLTTFLGFRVDAFLLAALLAESSSAIGYYSMAVTLAEMTFLIPSAVESVFFPHIAGSSRESADRDVLLVARVTVLLTGLSALALVPIGAVLIATLLPAFAPSLVAFAVLLPGVVAFSITKVVSGYVSGLGRTGLVSAVAIFAFVVNVVANLALIPPFGFVGAALASLVSYSASSVAITIVASRLTGAPFRAFWLVQPGDVRFVRDSGLALARRATRRAGGQAMRG